MAMVCDVGMNIHGSYVNGMNMYKLQSTRTLDGFFPYTWGFPKMGLPQIIQVMNDHDLDIETNGDFWVPIWGNLHIRIYVPYNYSLKCLPPLDKATTS